MHDIVEEDFEMVLVRVFCPWIWSRGIPGIFGLLPILATNEETWIETRHLP